nr:EboA domain-containing protein [Streptomyces candidus]
MDLTGDPAALRTALESSLGEAGRAWLREALAQAQAQAQAQAGAGAEAGAPGPRAALPPWEIRFAEAGRHCDAPGAAAARVLLLCTAGVDAPTLHRLYAHGTAAERRAVLLALPHLAHAREGSALPLVEDALRTNDTRLVAAAVGPYASAHLDPHAWRHAVLKCLFTGVPVDSVHALARRARGDSELARMLADYAAERTAAGRPVPDDLTHALTLTATTAHSDATPCPAPVPAPKVPAEES